MQEHARPKSTLTFVQTSFLYRFLSFYTNRISLQTKLLVSVNYIAIAWGLFQLGDRLEKVWCSESLSQSLRHSCRQTKNIKTIFGQTEKFIFLIETAPWSTDACDDLKLFCGDDCFKV